MPGALTHKIAAEQYLEEVRSVCERTTVYDWEYRDKQNELRTLLALAQVHAILATVK